MNSVAFYNEKQTNGGRRNLRNGSKNVDFNLFLDPFSPDGSILDLPEDIIHLLLSYLPFKDLVKCRRVSSQMLNLIDGNKKLWSEARLHLLWPTDLNRNHILKAAKAGNFEAQIKLATTYVYDEAQTVPFEENNDIRGRLSHEMFELADRRISSSSPPISWIFFRPPWRSSDQRNVCCKIKLFRHLVELTEDRNCGSRALFLVGKVLSLMSEAEPSSNIEELVRRAVEADGGGSCSHAALMLMRIEQSNGSSNIWERPRKLREILAKNAKCYGVQLTLCEEYLAGRYGGIDYEMATSFVRKIFAESKLGISFSIPAKLTRPRVVVISWIIEVANEHSCSPSVLHLAIDLFDRFLERQLVSRTKLQLLGITCLVLSTRLLDLRTLTIAQAAWLTDNTYHYMDVVQTMGHIVATLKGRLQRWTTLDYLMLLVNKSGCDRSVHFMTHYLLEQSLFLLQLRNLPQAVLAASCYQLAAIILRQDIPWPKPLQEWTAFTKESVSKTTMYLYRNIFSNQSMDTPEWKSTLLKYSQEKFYCVSTDRWRIPSFREVCILFRSGGCLHRKVVEIGGLKRFYVDETTRSTVTRLHVRPKVRGSDVRQEENLIFLKKQANKKRLKMICDENKVHCNRTNSDLSK